MDKAIRWGPGGEGKPVENKSRSEYNRGGYGFADSQDTFPARRIQRTPSFDPPFIILRLLPESNARLGVIQHQSIVTPFARNDDRLAKRAEVAINPLAAPRHEDHAAFLALVISLSHFNSTPDSLQPEGF